MERWHWLPRLEALLVAPGNGPRPPIDLQRPASETIAISPEASLERVERFLGGTSRLERLALRVRRALADPGADPGGPADPACGSAGADAPRRAAPGFRFSGLPRGCRVGCNPQARGLGCDLPTAAYPDLIWNPYGC